MHRPWWKRLADRWRGRWWPVHYRIDGSTWWSFRGKQYLFREGSDRQRPSDSQTRGGQSDG